MVLWLLAMGGRRRLGCASRRVGCGVAFRLFGELGAQGS